MIRTFKIDRIMKMSRVPFGVLLAFVISTISSVSVFAETVGDFEKYLGYTPEQIEESMKEYKENEPKRDVDTSYLYESVDDTVKIEHLRDKANKSKSELEAFFITQANPNRIKSLYQTYIKDYGNYNNQLKATRSEINTEVASGYNTDNSINFVDYDIGTIGEYIKPITKSLSLVTPYGYPIVEEFDTNDAGEHGDKTGIKAIGNIHNGIDISARENDLISVQWNGKVIDIKDEDIAGLKAVEVYHGNGLYTKYSHLKSAVVSLGSIVGQYETLGTAGNSSKCECNKTFQGKTIEQLTNHIHFEVRVEKENINPLLIYQENGKDVFNKWYTSSSCKYAVPSGTIMYMNPKKEIKIDNTNVGTEYLDEVMQEYWDNENSNTLEEDNGEQEEIQEQEIENSNKTGNLGSGTNNEDE